MTDSLPQETFVLFRRQAFFIVVPDENSAKKIHFVYMGEYQFIMRYLTILM